MKNIEFEDVKIDHNADYVARASNTNELSTWFCVDAVYEDGMGDCGPSYDKRRILVKLVPFVEWLGFEASDDIVVVTDPHEPFDEFYSPFPTVVVDDGEEIDADDFLEINEGRLKEFLNDSKNTDAWIFAGVYRI
jgi:hypothetical protein